MNIIFDQSAKRIVWDVLHKQITDLTCPFCGVEIMEKNFAGAFFHEGKLRPINKDDLMCLLAYARYIRENNL